MNSRSKQPFCHKLATLCTTTILQCCLAIGLVYCKCLDQWKGEEREDDMGLTAVLSTWRCLLFLIAKFKRQTLKPKVGQGARQFYLLNYRRSSISRIVRLCLLTLSPFGLSRSPLMRQKCRRLSTVCTNWRPKPVKQTFVISVRPKVPQLTIHSDVLLRR